MYHGYLNSLLGPGILVLQKVSTFNALADILCLHLTRWEEPQTPHCYVQQVHGQMTRILLLVSREYHDHGAATLPDAFIRFGLSVDAPQIPWTLHEMLTEFCLNWSAHANNVLLCKITDFGVCLQVPGVFVQWP